MERISPCPLSPSILLILTTATTIYSLFSQTSLLLLSFNAFTILCGHTKPRSHQWEKCGVCLSENGLFCLTSLNPVTSIFLQMVSRRSLWMKFQCVCVYVCITLSLFPCCCGSLDPPSSSTSRIHPYRFPKTSATFPLLESTSRQALRKTTFTDQGLPAEEKTLINI